MAKINEEILHKTTFLISGFPLYYCATIDPHDLRAFDYNPYSHGGIRIWIGGAIRCEEIAQGAGFDRWLEYRCELAKVMLNKRISKNFAHQYK